jgi:hypothetical protein
VPSDHLRLPRDFLDEVEIELQAAHRRSARNRARVDALEQLRRLSRAIALELHRPITAFDVIRSTDEPHERERLRQLVRELRSYTENSLD